MLISKLKQVTIAFLLSNVVAHADVSLPNIFSDHMVLQRHQSNPIWGKANPGERINVTIATQEHSAVADKNGQWKVELDSLEAGGPHSLKVSGQNQITIEDILIGEVWVCAGQSNMQWSVRNSNHSDLEIAAANYPEIRLLNIPFSGTQEPQFDIDATWETCTPQSVPEFSAAGYFFGRRLHTILGVPIGLINTSKGASHIETWIPREAMDATGEYTELLQDWDQAAERFTDATLQAQQKTFEAWEDAGRPGKRKWPPRDIRTSQNRPANGYNGVIKPILGYGLAGAIWCQGESNVGRSYQYRSLFPLLISTWRDQWGQGDFPFYWVQLADFNQELAEPGPSNWAEHREAQTMTLSMPNTGEVVSIDTGEGRDIHPRDKQTIGSRLARHPLSKVYGYDLQANSPLYSSMEIEGSKITITFDNIDQGLYAFDTKTVSGFAIAGEDQKFVWADAKIISEDKIEISTEAVINPVSVRYGWADNPIINLYDRNGLPVTPFRTDDWPGVTVNAKKAHRQYE